MRVELAAAVLRLPNGRLVFNRRAADDSQAGGLIGLFSGGRKPPESIRETMLRELAEESSLAVGGLVLTHLVKLEFPPQETEGHDGGTSDIFLVDIPTDEFEVYEGDRITLSYDEAMAHPNLAPSLRALLPILKEKIYGA